MYTAAFDTFIIPMPVVSINHNKIKKMAFVKILLK